MTMTPYRPEDDLPEPQDDVLAEMDRIDEDLLEQIDQDSRWTSGVPESERGDDLDFIQMTGLTRPAAPGPSADDVLRSEQALDDDGISFYEEGVADVDAAMLPAEPAPESAPPPPAPEAGARAAMSDLKDILDALSAEGETENEGTGEEPPLEDDMFAPLLEDDSGASRDDDLLVEGPASDEDADEAAELPVIDLSEAERVLEELAAQPRDEDDEPARAEPAADEAAVEQAAFEVLPPEAEATVQLNQEEDGPAVPEQEEAHTASQPATNPPTVIPASSGFDPTELTAALERRAAEPAAGATQPQKAPAPEPPEVESAEEEAPADGSESLPEPLPTSAAHELPPPAATDGEDDAEDEPDMAPPPFSDRRRTGRAHRRSTRGSRARRKFIRVAALVVCTVAFGAAMYYIFLPTVDMRLLRPALLYDEAVERSNDGSYLQASRLFSEFATRNPASPLKAEAEYRAAFAMQQAAAAPGAPPDRATEMNDEALALFAQFVDANPDHPRVPRAETLMGVLNTRLARYEKAIGILRDPRLRSRDPDGALAALRALAEAHAALGQYDEAQSAWLQAATAAGNAMPELDYDALASLHYRQAQEAAQPDKERHIALAKERWNQALRVPGLVPRLREQIERQLADIDAGVTSVAVSAGVLEPPEMSPEELQHLMIDAAVNRRDASERRPETPAQEEAVADSGPPAAPATAVQPEAAFEPEPGVEATVEPGPQVVEEAAVEPAAVAERQPAVDPVVVEPVNVPAPEAAAVSQPVAEPEAVPEAVAEVAAPAPEPITDPEPAVEQEPADGPVAEAQPAAEQGPVANPAVETVPQAAAHEPPVAEPERATEATAETPAREMTWQERMQADAARMRKLPSEQPGAAFDVPSPGEGGGN